MFAVRFDMPPIVMPVISSTGEQQKPRKASRLMRKFSSRSSARSSSSLRGSKARLEESMMAIRATIWPRPDLARFTEILDASPNLVKVVVGEKGETLLHR